MISKLPLHIYSQLIMLPQSAEIKEELTPLLPKPLLDLPAQNLLLVQALVLNSDFAKSLSTDPSPQNSKTKFEVGNSPRRARPTLRIIQGTVTLQRDINMDPRDPRISKKREIAMDPQDPRI